MKRPLDHVFPGMTAKGTALFVGIVRPHWFWRHVPMHESLFHMEKWPWQSERTAEGK